MTCCFLLILRNVCNRSPWHLLLSGCGHCKTGKGVESLFSLREERDNRFAKGMSHCREKHGVSMIFRLHSPLYSLTGYSGQVGQGVVYLSTLGSLCCTCGHPTTSLSHGSVRQGSATCAWADPDVSLGACTARGHRCQPPAHVLRVPGSAGNGKEDKDLDLGFSSCQERFTQGWSFLGAADGSLWFLETLQISFRAVTTRVRVSHGTALPLSCRGPEVISGDPFCFPAKGMISSA